MFFSHFVKTLPALLSFMYIVTGNEQQLGSNTENVTNIVPPDNSHLLDWIPPGNIAQEYPYYLSGYDYNNIPVLVHPWGKWDTRRVAEKGGQEEIDLTRRNDQFIERVKKSYFQRHVNESEVGSGEDEIVLVIDYDGFDLRQVQSQKNMRIALKFFEKLESCYEKIAYGYIVNANTLVDGLLNFGKGLMGRFMERMEVHGTNSRKFIPQILKKIPPSELSPLYGGYDGFKPIASY